MPLPKGLSKAELQKLYGKKLKLKNWNLHHTTPSSRGGETNEFNLFPFRVKSHNAYHSLFLNMTIWEVWEVIDKTYEAIFINDDKKIKRFWLCVCKLSNGDEKLYQVEKKFSTIELQEYWIKAFGGDSLQQSQKTLKYMMLFIIFGRHTVNSSYLFDNGNLMEFFKKYPPIEDRFKAFNICFGRFADYQNIKSKMSKIMR